MTHFSTLILAGLGILGVVAPHSGQAQTTAPPKPGELINGDFAQIGENGLPAGWTFTKTPWIEAGAKTAKGPKNAAAKATDGTPGKTPEKTKAEPGDKTSDGVSIATLKDGSRTIVSITYKDNQEGSLVQVVDVPPKSKEARFKVSVRGTPDVEGGRKTMPDCGFRFFNAEGTHLPGPKDSKPPKQLSGKSWNEVEFSVDLPQGATTCNVFLGNTDRTNGTFEFRDVEVKFR